MGVSSLEKDGRRRAVMDAIFREHFAEVHAFIFSRVRQPEAADDLTSMVFLKAFRWLLEDRGLRQVRSWLYSTARTTIADYWREQLITLPLDAIADSAAAPSGGTLDGRLQERVQDLLSQLPVREREVLLLRYLRGYSAAETGQALGLTAGHVRVLQLRALRQAARFEEMNDVKEERKLSHMQTVDFTCTEQGQRVLMLAKEEALALDHHYIGTEHLLLGILAEGSAAAPLLEQGTTLERVRAGLLFLVGRDQGDTQAEAPLTPYARQILACADQEARESGEQAIGPQHILYALQGADGEYGISYGMLQSLGVERRPGQLEQTIDEEVNRSALAQQELLVELYPTLSSEEELHLAHLVQQAEKDKRRAAYLNSSPDSSIAEEGKLAYFRLFMASQQLVLTAAREYMESCKDVGRLLEAGNKGLSYAIHKFGLKTQVPFRQYATHWIHLEIMESMFD
ncbi:hypothetical protein KDH_21950 [Dictyobacter sp. S3.2.2.5]|uniref:Clp R domain-containing protein n=1 Tax=Dictyobacter halimunensis TaxID=3026934 RepID=A0ABQ6FM68_9CHLR|nr:hypothetical protein KDH_21950 [Dictyobacter sp. S3.2.2.5]